MPSEILADYKIAIARLELAKNEAEGLRDPQGNPIDYHNVKVEGPGGVISLVGNMSVFSTYLDPSKWTNGDEVRRIILAYHDVLQGVLNIRAIAREEDRRLMSLPDWLKDAR